MVVYEEEGINKEKSEQAFETEKRKKLGTRLPWDYKKKKMDPLGTVSQLICSYLSLR